MQVTIGYETLLKRAAGRAADVLTLTNECTVADVVRAVASLHGDDVRPMLLDAAGNIRPSLLIFRGDEQVSWDAVTPVEDGDMLTLMSPISGG